MNFMLHLAPLPVFAAHINAICPWGPYETPTSRRGHTVRGPVSRREPPCRHLPLNKGANFRDPDLRRMRTDYHRWWYKALRQEAFLASLVQNVGEEEALNIARELRITKPPKAKASKPPRKAPPKPPVAQRLLPNLFRPEETGPKRLSARQRRGMILWWQQATRGKAYWDYLAQFLPPEELPQKVRSNPVDPNLPTLTWWRKVLWSDDFWEYLVHHLGEANAGKALAELVEPPRRPTKPRVTMISEEQLPPKPKATANPDKEHRRRMRAGHTPAPSKRKPEAPSRHGMPRH